MNGEDRTAATISLIRKTSQKIRKVIRVKANATPSTRNPTKERRWSMAERKIKEWIAPF